MDPEQAAARSVEVRLARYQAAYSSGIWRAKLFRDIVLDEIRERGPGAVVLDIGCGEGFDDSPAIQREIADAAGVYAGLEPDPAVQVPEWIRPLYRGLLEEAETPREFADVAFAVMVLEHVADPDRFLRALHDALKPGGVFWGFTMDRRHYMPLASTAMEVLRIKDLYLNLLHGKRGEDRYLNYPTFYRLNTPGRIRRHAAGFRRVDILNFRRVGQQDAYFPRWLRPAAHLLDRAIEALGLPGSLLACRLEK